MTQDIASLQSAIAACVQKGLPLLAGAALAWSCLSNAQAAQAPAPAQDASAHSSGRPIDPLRQRLAALGESELKQVYLRCSREAVERLLDLDDAVFCSTAYDVLLKGHFGGDFSALLDWSRQQRDELTDESIGSAAPLPTQFRGLRRIDRQ